MKKLLSLLIGLSLCSFLNAMDLGDGAAHPSRLARNPSGDARVRADRQRKSYLNNLLADGNMDQHEVELSLQDRDLWYTDPQEHYKQLRQGLAKLAEKRQKLATLAEEGTTDEEQSSGTNSPNPSEQSSGKITPVKDAAYSAFLNNAPITCKCPHCTSCIDHKKLRQTAHLSFDTPSDRHTKKYEVYGEGW